MHSQCVNKIIPRGALFPSHCSHTRKTEMAPPDSANCIILSQLFDRGTDGGIVQCVQRFKTQPSRRGGFAGAADGAREIRCGTQKSQAFGLACAL